MERSRRFRVCFFMGFHPVRFSGMLLAGHRQHQRTSMTPNPVLLEPRSAWRRRRFLGVLPLCLPLPSPGAQQAGRSVLRLVTAGAAGSVPDQYARRLAALLQPELGVTVVVDNRPGANGTLSVDALLRAPADGHTLLVAGSNVLCVTPALKLNTGYEPLRDMVPVGLVASGYPAVIVQPRLPVKTLVDLVAHARARSGGLRVGSPGVGSVQHLAAHQWQLQARVPLQHVPYTSAGAVLADLIGGHIDMAIEYASAAVPLLRAGRLKALAVLGTRRWPVLPDVSTAHEQGVTGIEAGAWLGVVARAGTATDVLDDLNRAIIHAAADAEFMAWVQNNGSEMRTGSRADFADLVQRDLGRWTRLVAAAGIRVN